MPIPAQDLADQIRFGLDAEGADHYDDNRDIIPSINAAQRWLVSAINKTLGEKKLGEEIFRDLTNARVFQTSAWSRISLAAFPHEVWTILAVYPLPNTEEGEVSFPPTSGDDNDSFELKDLFHISSNHSAKRLTVEEWNNNKGNPFEAGYEGDAICDELKEYAYLDPIDYNYDGDENTTIKEIEVRPRLNKEQCTVVYVKKPNEVLSLLDDVEFPDSVFQLLFNKALQYISYKQGDQTNLYSVTNADIAVLTSLIS